MKLRRTLFLLSILLHLIGIYWIARVKIPLLIFPEKERVIQVVPISLPPSLDISSTLDQGKGSPGQGKGKESFPGSPSAEKSPTGTPYPASGEDQNQVQGIIEKPKRIAPPADVKKIPELSIYSENMQDLLRNFNRGRAAGSGGRTGSGAGSKGGSGSGESSGSPVEGQVIFDLDNYDLSSWAKQVLIRIQRNWWIPWITKEKVERPVEIATVIEKSGRISSWEVKISSNSGAFDQAALNALLLSSPLASLPGDFPNKNLEARFRFVSATTTPPYEGELP